MGRGFEPHRAHPFAGQTFAASGLLLFPGLSTKDPTLCSLTGTRSFVRRQQAQFIHAEGLNGVSGWKSSIPATTFREARTHLPPECAAAKGRPSRIESRTCGFSALTQDPPSASFARVQGPRQALTSVPLRGSPPGNAMGTAEARSGSAASIAWTCRCGSVLLPELPHRPTTSPCCTN